MSSSFLPKMLVALLLLVQACSFMRMGDRTVTLSGGHEHAGSCIHDHDHDTDHAASTSPTLGMTLVGLATGNTFDRCAFECCPCPHVHVGTVDASSSVRRDRPADDALKNLRFPHIIRVGVHIEPRGVTGGTCERHVRHLEADHPPPPPSGSDTTLLLI